MAGRKITIRSVGEFRSMGRTWRTYESNDGWQTDVCVRPLIGPALSSAQARAEAVRQIKRGRGLGGK